jgi:thymidylate synthase (FAD)
VSEVLEHYEQEITIHEPHGFVRLVEYMGDEVAVCNAARVSLAKETEWDDEMSTRLKGDDAGLISFLMREKHGTPFEMGFIAQFHCRVPIFVMREWIRHRVGFSYNEESGRYVKMRPDFFIPETIRTQQGKPGAYTFEESDDRGLTDYFKGILKYQSERDYSLYEEMLEHGIAKEQARLFLPLNLYTEFRWTCNARSLMNFLVLRNDSHAMKEIRDYAMAVEQIFADRMPYVHDAFEKAGRVAP